MVTVTYILDSIKGNTLSWTLSKNTKKNVFLIFVCCLAKSKINRFFTKITHDLSHQWISFWESIALDTPPLRT